MLDEGPLMAQYGGTERWSPVESEASVSRRYREDLARFEVRVYDFDGQSVTLEILKVEGNARVQQLVRWAGVQVPINAAVIEEVACVVDGSLGAWLRAKWGVSAAPAPRQEAMIV
jgi:hypothetical protein